MFLGCGGLPGPTTSLTSTPDAAGEVPSSDSNPSKAPQGLWRLIRTREEPLSVDAPQLAGTLQ